MFVRPSVRLLACLLVCLLVCLSVCPSAWADGTSDSFLTFDTSDFDMFNFSFDNSVSDPDLISASLASSKVDNSAVTSDIACIVSTGSVNQELQTSSNWHLASFDNFPRNSYFGSSYRGYGNRSGVSDDLIYISYWFRPSNSSIDMFAYKNINASFGNFTFDFYNINGVSGYRSLSKSDFDHAEIQYYWGSSVDLGGGWNSSLPSAPHNLNSSYLRWNGNNFNGSSFFGSLVTAADVSGNRYNYGFVVTFYFRTPDFLRSADTFNFAYGFRALDNNFVSFSSDTSFPSTTEQNTSAINQMTNQMQEVASQIAGMTSTINQMNSAISGMTAQVQQLGQQLMQVANAVQDGTSQIVNKVDSLTTSINSSIDQQTNAIREALGLTTNSINTGFSNVVNVTQQQTQTIQQGFSSVSQTVSQGFTQTQKSIDDASKQAHQDAQQAHKDAETAHEDSQSMPNRIGEMLKKVFIPDAEDMQSYKDKFEDLLSEKLGFVWQVMDDMIVGLFNTIISGVTDPQTELTIPAIPLPADMGYLMEETSFPIVPEGAESIIVITKRVTNIVILLLLIQRIIDFKNRFLEYSEPEEKIHVSYFDTGR